MTKWIVRFFLLIISIFLVFVVYLSTIGIETKSFNNTIQNRLKAYNQIVNLDFKKVKLLLDLKDYKIKVKLIEPKLISGKEEIKFRKLNSNISLKSYFDGNFAIEKINLKTEKLEIKKFIKFTRLLNPTPFLFVLNNSIKRGIIEGETELFFIRKG